MKINALSAPIALAKPANVPSKAPISGSSLPDVAQKEVKKSGWASVGGQSQAVPSSAPSGRGWATVSSPAQPAPPRNAAWQSLPSLSRNDPPPPPPDTTPAEPSKAPATTNSFRSGGFTTLATTETGRLPLEASAIPQTHPSQARNGWSSLPEASPPPPSSSSLPPAPPPSSNRASAQPTTSAPAPPAPVQAPSVPSTIPPAPPTTENAPPPPPFPSLNPPPAVEAIPPGLPSLSPNPPQHKEKKSGKKSRPPAAEEPQSRGNWQSFQRGRGRR